MSNLDTMFQDSDLIAELEAASAPIPDDVKVIDPEAKPEGGFKNVVESDEEESETPEVEATTEDTEETEETEEVADTTEETTEEEPEEEAPAPILQGNDLIRSLREQHKDNAKAIREKDKQVSQLEAQIEAAQAPPATAPTERIPPADIFVGLVQVNNGDRQQSDLPVIKQNINKMSMEDLADVQSAAQNGQFGDMSEDVLDVVNQNIPTVMVNESRNKKETNTHNAWQLSRNKAWNEVNSIPGMDDKTSDLYKNFVAAENDLLSRIPSIKLEAEAPMKVLEHMDLLSRASSASANGKLKAENEQLRKQLNISQGGGTTKGGTAPSTKAASVSPEDQFLIDIGQA